jgi:hypothetical protein
LLSCSVGYKQNKSSNRPAVRLSVNFYIFDFFSRTTGPILTRFGRNHLWGKGIQNCINEGQYPCPRGDNSKRGKMYTEIKKKSFLEPASQFQLLGATCNHPWVKGI